MPDYLSNLSEAVQRRAMKIIFPGIDYKEALALSALLTLSQRRVLPCTRFINNLSNTKPLGSLCLDEAECHGYNFRSGDCIRLERPRGRTERFSAFCTNKFRTLRATLRVRV